MPEFFFFPIYPFFLIDVSYYCFTVFVHSFSKQGVWEASLFVY